MKVLLLSPYPDALANTLQEEGDSFTCTSDAVDIDFCISNRIDFIVSYGYRHRIDNTILDYYPMKSVNLHISFLPYARGAHPNFWSIKEGSPTGVTIHLLERGLDTGNILFQKEVCIDHDIHSFATSYRLLCREIERLFIINWKYIRRAECAGWRQEGEFTYHRAAEIEPWLSCLPQMWDTKISLFEQLASEKSGLNEPSMG